MELQQAITDRSQLVTPGGGQEMGTGGNPGPGYVVGLVGKG